MVTQEETSAIPTGMRHIKPIGPSASIKMRALEREAAESRYSVQTFSTFFNIAFTFGDRNAANPARVIIGKSRTALIGQPTIPVVLNSGAEVSTWLRTTSI